jgi:soluble lytic murein transglycosylase-like protein
VPAPATPTTPSTAATTPRPTKASPSKNPKATLPPPPAPPRTTPPGCTPTVRGTAASYANVRAALKVSAGHTYWASVPSIRVPERLLVAVAMTESSWRSNVIACDGGIGLMQVMPDTVSQINNRFGTKWDVNTLQGNAHLGANYLAWTVRYLGDLYFGGSYDLSNQALMDGVIAAYNYGAGAIDPTKGAAGIPNPGYVSQVKQYMAGCPCDAW